MTGFIKDPDATLDYTINWSKFLNGDTISTSAWTVPSGLTQVLVTNTTTTATVWISGGTLDVVYEVSNRMTSTAGRIDDRTFTITIKQK